MGQDADEYSDDLMPPIALFYHSGDTKSYYVVDMFCFVVSCFYKDGISSSWLHVLFLLL